MAEPTQFRTFDRLAEGTLFMAVTLLVAVVSPRATQILAVLFCLLIWVGHVPELRGIVVRPSLVLAALAAFVAWLGASMAWSVAPDLSLERTLRMSVLLFLGAPAVLMLVRSNRVGPEFAWPHWVAMAVIGYLLFEAVAGWPVYKLFLGDTDPYDRLLSILALLVWPLAAVLRRRYGWSEAVLAVAVVISLMAMSFNNAGQLAILAGTIVFVAYLVSATLARVGLYLCLLFFGVMLPIIATQFSEQIVSLVTDFMGDKPGLQHRLTIWQFALEKWSELPLFGWGVGSTRAIPGGQELRQFLSANGAVIGEGNLLPLHPHNGFLQVQLETGAVGLGLLLLTLGLIVHTAVRRKGEDWQGAAVAAALTAGVVLGATKFGVWQGWWLGAQLIAAMALATCRVSTTTAQPLASVFPTQEELARYGGDKAGEREWKIDPSSLVDDDKQPDRPGVRGEGR